MRLFTSAMAVPPTFSIRRVRGTALAGQLAVIDKSVRTEHANLAALSGLPTASSADTAGTAGSQPQVPYNAPDLEQSLPEIQGYQMLSEIGRGGMGRVWAATQLGTHRKVAIKFLPPLASERARARFEREVDLASKLKHPNIISIYDSGIYRGDYFYVMEYVEGVHLDEYVRRHRLGDTEITILMAKVCRAVEHAHQFGVIHRDLKPSNILVTPDGQPHVLDFGLAKAALDDTNAIAISLSGEVAGTPAYMSPEQAAGRSDLISTRSDVYSLGVILYVLLTGKFTHAPENMVDLPRMTATEDVIPPRVARPRIDAGLENLLLMALQLRPEKRYSSAGELARDLENYPDGAMIARPESSRDMLAKHFRHYYGPIAIGAALGAVFVVILAMEMFNTPQVKTVSLVDMMAFIITFPIALVFIFSYFTMGRRLLDLLFGLAMLMTTTTCLSVFLQDNIVPINRLASDFASGASQNLLLVQICFATGLIGLPIQIHFAIRYCGIQGWSRLRLGILYGTFGVATAGAFTPLFLSARVVPLDKVANFSCMVPWAPQAGVGAYAFLPLWTLIQATLQVVLWRTKRRGRPLARGPLSQIDLIRLGMGFQGLGVIVDALMCATSTPSISIIPFTAVLTGLVYSVALVRERMTSEFPVSTAVSE